MTNDERLTESDSRLQDGNIGDGGRARGSGGRASQDVGVEAVTEPTMRPRTEPRVGHADDGDSDNGAGGGLEPIRITCTSIRRNPSHWMSVHVCVSVSRADCVPVQLLPTTKEKFHFDIRTTTYATMAWSFVA